MKLISIKQSQEQCLQELRINLLGIKLTLQSDMLCETSQPKAKLQILKGLLLEKDNALTNQSTNQHTENDSVNSKFIFTLKH